MWFIKEKCACGQKLEKEMNVCPRCGVAREGAWRSCHDCGASVGGQARACWKCGADLTAQPVRELFGDRWRRDAGDFAVRYPLRVPKGVLKHGIQVDAGTRAHLMVNGRHEGELGPGYHVKSSFFERLTNIQRLSEHAEALLAVDGPAVVTFGIDGLRDAEQVPLEAEVRLELWLRQPERFMERVMPGKQVFRETDFRDLLAAETRQALMKQAARYRIESLLADVSQREALEAVLGEEMPRILEIHGLGFGGVRLAEFGGAAVEGIRNRMGKKALTQRELEIQRGIDALMREHEIDRMKGETQVSAVRRRLEHDLGLEHDELDFVRTQLRQRAEHTLRMESLRHQRDATAATEEIRSLEADAERRRDEEDLKMAARAREGALDALERMKRMETDEQLRLARGLKDCPPGAIAAAMAGHPGVGEALVALGAVQRGMMPGFGASPSWPLPSATPPPAGLHGNPYARPFGGVGGNPYGGGAGHGQWRAGFFSTGSAAVEDPRTRAVVEQALGAVGVIRVVGADGRSRPTGTGWMVGPKVMVTNAHVAKAVVDETRDGSHSCWVGFCDDGGAREARVEKVVLHPQYGTPGPGPRGEEPVVPANDVALLVLDVAQPFVLPVADPNSLLNLGIGDRVMYLGFPNEGLAGPGVNENRPAPIFKQGAVSQLTDWWAGRASFEQSQLIHHDLGVAGGASGSPLLDRDGQVVGVVCAGNMSATVNASTGGLQRTPSGVLINFAQRVDVLGALFERVDPHAG